MHNLLGQQHRRAQEPALRLFCRKKPPPDEYSCRYTRFHSREKIRDPRKNRKNPPQIPNRSRPPPGTSRNHSIPECATNSFLPIPPLLENCFLLFI